MLKSLLLSVSGLFVAGTCAASTVDFSLSISGDTNVPLFTITNTSAPGIQIDSLSISIGRTDRNFDYARDVSTGPLVAPLDGGVDLIIGDKRNSGDRTDELLFAFVGFDPGEVFTFTADIDPDSQNAVQDYTDTLFNNGSQFDNSRIKGIFSNRMALTFELPDTPLPLGPRLDFTAKDLGVLSTVPAPAGLPMLLAGFAAFGFLRRRD